MSDTPRADAGHWLYEDEAGEGFDVVDFVLACQLERELNASEARVKELEDLCRIADARFFSYEQRIKELQGRLNEALEALGYPVPGDTPAPRYRCGLCDAREQRIKELKTEILYLLVKIFTSK